MSTKACKKWRDSEVFAAVLSVCPVLEVISASDKLLILWKFNVRAGKAYKENDEKF